MQKIFDDVKAFSVAADVEIADFPQWPAQGELKLRYSLIEEEVMKELLGTMAQVILDPTNRTTENLHLVFDACLDSIYVITQFMVVAGLPAAQGWAIVQLANMAKIDPETGKVVRREDGKILKPEGWESPDPKTLALLELMIADGQTSEVKVA